MPNETVTVQIAGGPTIAVLLVQPMNAQQALESAYNQVNDSQKFTYALQYFGRALGYFVFMINETYDSFLSKAAPYWYWEFLINGKRMNKGIDNINLNPNDNIGFAYVPYQPEIHKESTLQIKYERQQRSLR